MPDVGTGAGGHAPHAHSSAKCRRRARKVEATASRRRTATGHREVAPAGGSRSRSARRPACIASSTGAAANSASSTPTAQALWPSRSACSGAAMRTPAMAACRPIWPTISASSIAAEAGRGAVAAALQARGASVGPSSSSSPGRAAIAACAPRAAPRPTSAGASSRCVRVCACVDGVGWPRRASSCVLASTSPNLPNSVFTAPSTSQTSARALLQRQRAKAHLQAGQRGQQRGRAGEHDLVLALQRLHQPGPAQRLGIQAFGGHEQDARSRWCAAARCTCRGWSGPRAAAAFSMRLGRQPPWPAGRRAPARRAGARSPRAGTWRRSAATAARRRRAGPGRRIANSTRSLLPGTVATLVAYCSGVNTCSSRPASCTSPKMPRVLTLVSTRLSEPTSRASACISPRPLCTCSSRSATCLKLSPRRCSSVACSFSSTVARICSSFFSLPSCSAASRGSTVLRTSPRRRSLASDRAQLLAQRRQALQRRPAHRAPTGSAATAPASRPAARRYLLLHGGQLGAEGVDLLVLRARDVAACASRSAGTATSCPPAPAACRARCRCTSSRSSRSSRSASAAAAQASPSAFRAVVGAAQQQPQQQQQDQPQQRAAQPFDHRARLSQGARGPAARQAAALRRAQRQALQTMLIWAWSGRTS